MDFANITEWYKNKKRYVFQILMFVYLMMVIEKTLFPIEFIDLEYNIWDRINLVPFSEGLTQNGILNIIMTVPFGFLLPCVKRGSITAFKALLYALLLSICIEILQPLINGARSSDITDVITNTIGGIIGYTAYVVCKPFIIKVLFHWENTRFCA